ncbi:hypothetical protein BHM03_00048266, partial [Ensete ventricosum]
MEQSSVLAGKELEPTSASQHKPRFSLPSGTAQYIPVRQLTGTGRYRKDRPSAVDFGHRRSISAVDGRFPPSTVDLRRNRPSMAEEEEKKKKKKKKRRRSTSHRPSGDSARGSPASRRCPRCPSAVTARIALAPSSTGESSRR